VVKELLLLLPARLVPVFYGLVKQLIGAESAAERERLLRKAAHAVGYKEGARLAMDAALRAKKKL
jgi:hypothetical protein